jgi:hypothetical protein
MLGDRIQYNNQLMEAFLRVQLRKARETPALTKLTTFNLQNPTSPAPTALQILTKNDKRASVGIYNTGPADILIAEQWFDPTTVLQWFSDPLDPDTILPGFNQSIPIGFLGATQPRLTLDGTTGLWAYSLGSQASSNKNAVVSLADSVYVTDGVKLDSQVEAFHLSGLHPSEEPGGGVTK